MTDYRKQFADFGETVYLDCAYQGPFPLATAERIEEAIGLKTHPYRLTHRHYFDLPERVRALLARLLRADPLEIALTNSATQGLGLAANGLNLEAGDEVVVSSGNFPSNLFTWLHLRRRGVEVRVLCPQNEYPTLEEIEAALTRRTRVVALDHVNYVNGCRIALEAIGELVHRHGSVFVVDATQSVGALPLNVRELAVDILVVAAYKWLLGPYGTGFAFLDEALLDRLDLQTVNWVSVEGSENFDALPREEFRLPRAARIFDVPETANYLNLYGLEASLEFVQGVGVERIREHCYHLLDRLIEGLRRQGFRLNASAEEEHRSTLLSFSCGSARATERLYERLRSHRIAVSLRHGMIRVSPYLYNTEQDIDRLLEVAGVAEVS